MTYPKSFFPKSLMRGDGIGEKWTHSMIGMTHPDPKIGVFSMLEILRVNTYLSTLCGITADFPKRVDSFRHFE